MNAGDKPRVEVLAVPSKVLMAMPGTLGTREYGDAEEALQVMKLTLELLAFA